jgi:hypothetical protein
MTAIYTVARTWANGDIPDEAMLNTHIRDNFDYLVARPVAQEADYDSAADFTTTSTSFVATGITEDITILAGARVEVQFWCLQSNSGPNAITYDIAVDTVRQGDATYGMFQNNLAGGLVANPTISRIMTGLSAGTRTIAIYWKTSAGTASIYQYGLTVKEI